MFEVYIPTLKSGIATRGVLIMTSRNGVPVPPEKMEKVRREAGEQLEKEENRIARQRPVQAAVSQQPIAGMKPLGMYTRMQMNRSIFGFNRGGMILMCTRYWRRLSRLYRSRTDRRTRHSRIQLRADLGPPLTQGRGTLHTAIPQSLDRCHGQDRDADAGWPTSAIASPSETEDFTGTPARNLLRDVIAFRWQLDAARNPRYRV